MQLWGLWEIGSGRGWRWLNSDAHRSSSVSTGSHRCVVSRLFATLARACVVGPFWAWRACSGACFTFYASFVVTRPRASVGNVPDCARAQGEPVELKPGVELRFAASTRRYRLPPPGAKQQQQQQQPAGGGASGNQQAEGGAAPRLPDSGMMPPPPPKRPRVCFADDAPEDGGALPSATVVVFAWHCCSRRTAQELAAAPNSPFDTLGCRVCGVWHQAFTSLPTALPSVPLAWPLQTNVARGWHARPACCH